MTIKRFHELMARYNRIDNYTYQTPTYYNLYWTFLRGHVYARHTLTQDIMNKVDGGVSNCWSEYALGNLP